MFFNIFAKNGVIPMEKFLGNIFPAQIFQKVYGPLKMRLNLNLLLWVRVRYAAFLVKKNEKLLFSVKKIIYISAIN